jgi:hypothetical protein
MDKPFKFFSWDEKNPTNKYTQPVPTNLSLGENGYPEEVKTTGIVVRGTKNQTKGKMARGPMA